MVEAPNILVVEDDPIQSAKAIKKLKDLLPQSRVSLVETEYDFRAQFPEIISNTPDFVAMDIILPWCSPSSDMPKYPEDVAIEGFFTAGLRLTRLIRSSHTMENTPVLLWSCIDMDDLKEVRYASDGLEGSYFLPKSSWNSVDFAEEVKTILEGKTPKHATYLSEFEVVPISKKL